MRQLELADACSLIASCGFDSRVRSYRTVGVELESFLFPTLHPATLPAPELFAGCRLTFEPGGQVELSSPPRATVAQACDAVSRDLAALRDAYSTAGVRLVQQGLTPSPAQRLVDSPRYQAMEAYFDRSWAGTGREMMCATASVQVNLGLGGGARAARRWRGANVVGPVLAAMFSSSPSEQGCGNRRLATWLRLDPGRTAPVPYRSARSHNGNGNGKGKGNGNGAGPVADHRRAWVDYALDAHVMLIRARDDDHRALLDGPLPARTWIEQGHEWGWPTAEDVAYHLTTLFPPVRPRGWLELRMIDSLPDPWWRVPVAVAAVLVDDALAVRACEPVAGRWWEAALDGLADVPLAGAAAVCAERSVAGLTTVGTDCFTADLVAQWAATVRKACEPPWR
jgi:glutamate--cysteine ligase